MKNFKEYLSERKQVGKLYHFTTLDKLVKILKDGLKSEALIDKDDNSRDGVSFTRNYRHAKDISHGGVFDLRITIDGDKLSDKYKITPFHDREYYKYQQQSGKKVEDEMEELVTTTKPIPIKKYILDIVTHTKKFDVIDKLEKKYGVKIRTGEINDKI